MKPEDIAESFKRDVFESDVDFVLEEASGEVDGKHIIGKVKGGFFVPDGTSRNNRFYPKDLWEQVLGSADVQEKMKSRRMLGTVGHDLMIDEKAVREGLVSHIVTNLKIEESSGKLRGVGEAVILDTPAGRSLNTLMRAGSKMFVSSRAFGKFSGTHNGVPKVDKSSYKFDTFDFVLDPGFAEANPKLVESLEINNKSSNKGDQKMDTELLEKVVKQNAGLQVDLSKAINEMDDYKAKYEASMKEMEELKKKLADAEAKMKDMECKMGDSSKSMEAYSKLGAAKEIEEALTGLRELNKKYQEIGTPEKISEALTKAQGLLTEYKVLGTPKEVNKAIEEATKTLKEYQELGKPVELNKALDEAIATIKKYQEFGTIDELTKVFEKMNKMASNMKSESVTKKVKELATELRVTEEAIRKLLEKGFKDEEIREVLKKVSESAVIANKYKKTETPAADAAAPVNESAGNGSKSAVFQTRLERIMGSFGK
jgi:SOS response regulatory protein OraA/RecX